MTEIRSIGASDEDAEGRFWEPAVVEVVADTVYVLDRGAASVIAFTKEGDVVATFGSKGQGPGEFTRPWGMAVSKERVYVSDAASRRLSAFAADDGHLIYSTELPSPFFGPMQALDDETVLAGVVTRDPSANGATRPGIATLSHDGTLLSVEAIVDSSLISPSSQVISGIGRDGTPERMTFTPPLQPEIVWAILANGAVIAGVGNRYEFQIIVGGGEATRTIVGPDYLVAASVLPEEAAWYLAWTTARVQRTFPNLSWPAEELPSRKPFFTALFADDSRRLWVLRPTGSRRVEVCDETFPTIQEIRQPTKCWEDELALDIFSVDEGFLGTLDVPDDIVVSPFPVLEITGEEVWAVTRRGDGNKMVTGYQLPSLE